MKKGLKRTLSAVSITLCALVAFALPVQVFAETVPEENNTTSSFDGVQGENEKIGNIVSELNAERTEYTKEFLLDDGTTMLAEYDQPVHYKNNKGDWVEYNNTLVNDTTSTADEASGDDLTNKTSDIDVKLSKKAKANNMVKVTSDGYSISWGYDNANKSKATVVNDTTKTVGNDKYTTLKNITSETKYENVYKNVDLQYFITSTGIKENIILKNSDVQNEFNLTYKIKNLTAKQTDDKTITLYNKDNKAVYTIDAPYMYDADGNTNTQLKIEIVSQKGNKLNVKLTADYWYLHSIGRAYPITIDPQLTTKQTSALSFWEGIGVASSNGGIVQSYGPYHASNNAYLVAKVNSLPALENGEKIISAKYNLETTNGASLFSSENDNAIIINAHKLTSLANNVASYDSTVLDYDSLTYNDRQYMSFDLTQLMNEWYDNGNSVDGFTLEAFDTVGSKQVIFRDATKSSTTPTLTVTYKDFTGTEGNLAYHSVSAGQNAQVSVSDYLGNAVVNQSIYAGTGARLPVSITATYNSINYNELFDNGSSTGYGWQFSFNQHVREANSTLIEKGYNYIYKDADGTDHYLKLMDDETAKWEDEDGLGLTVTTDENGLYIDNGSTTQTYQLPANGGKLLSEKDENNNTNVYTYSEEGNLTSITDGAGNVISISYYTNSEGAKRVRYIALPDGKKINIFYTSTARDKVSYISFADSKVSQFSYDSNDRLISVQQIDESSAPFTYGKKILLTYSDNGQVTKITEYGSDGTQGNYLDIIYNNDNTTIFSDRSAKSETHTFDNSGSTISVLNSYGNLQSSSNNNGLSISGGSDSYTKNYITESSEHNGIGNSNYYQKINSGKDGVSSSGGVCSIDTSEATEENGSVQYFGSSSIKVNNPVSSSNSAFFTGVAHQFEDSYFNGKDVTFSAYVKTKDVTQIYSGGAVGAILKIKCFDADGNTVRELNSLGITGTEEWQRLSISARVPSNTSYFRVYCMIRYASGTAWFDCLQLEDGNSANDYNALQNSNFETNENWLTNDNSAISAQNGTVSINGEAGAFEDVTTATEEATEEIIEETQPSTYYETVTETAPYDSITTYDDFGNAIKTEQGFVNREVKKTYEATTPTDAPVEETTVESEDDTSDTTTDSLGNKYVYQNVNVDRAGVYFNLYGEADAKSVPLSNENRTFGIALNIYYEGNSVPETHYQEFNSATSAKQSMSMSVTPDDENTEINYVAFAFVYGYNKNIMTAYNAMLNISAYSTDSTSTEETGDNTSTEDSTEDEDNYVDYEVLSESVDKTQTYMQTSTAYDTTGNYVTAETDEVGNTVTYTYDTSGNTTSVTDGEENVVNYTYNLSNAVSSVSSGNASNNYFYNGNGDIAKINHNNFNYTFNYDVYNNLIATKIGNVAIASNTYNTHNGHLIRTDYANGDYLTYMYDVYDNIIRISSETGTLISYFYNKKGLVSKSFDNSSEETTYYYYDFSGNLTGKYCQSVDGDLSYYLSTDADGNQIEKTNVNGHTKTITNGTDEDGNAYVSNDGVTVSKNSDDFGRITEVKTSRGEGNSVFFSNYTYANGSAENTTTNLVKSLTQKYGSTNLVNYEYSYDGNGNITEVKQNDSVVAVYNYDSLNQLSNAADKNSGLYTSFTYDNAGNITNVKEYNLVTSTMSQGTLESEKTYSYTDTNWKDKLTSFNGTNLTYDEIGNPLSYRDGMTFEWANGRNLQSITNGNETITMQYNANGMRTRQDNDDYTLHYYYDSNNNLTGLNFNGLALYFYYDDNGSVTSFKYGNAMYYYIKNLQGDIVKIIDHLGNTKVTYTYDAWGKVLSQTDTSMYNLANLNPFRYRGYVYDYKTGLYYLQSRYYDPITGRFLNADSYVDTANSVLSTNMFAYCENNAVCNVDFTGEWFFSFASYYNYNKKRIHGRAWLSWKSNYNNLCKRDKKNRNILRGFNNYIYGQDTYPVSGLSFGGGYYKVYSNGCGLVAVYNVMKYIGKFKYFQNVILEAEMNDMLWQGGMFGVKDEKIRSYFNAHKVKFTKYETLTKLKKNIDKYRITIVYVRNNYTLSRHYYCIVKKKNGYKTLNFHNNNKGYKDFNFNKIDDRHFIRAICVK